MEGVEKLEGWISFAEAAQLLDLTKEGFRHLIEKQKIIPMSAVRKIGSLLVVQESVVLTIKQERSEAAAFSEQMQKDRLMFGI